MYIDSNVIHNLCNIRGVLCLDGTYSLFYRDLAQIVTCCIFVLRLLCLRGHCLPTLCILQLFGLGTNDGNVIHSVFCGIQVIRVKKVTFT